jgi:hypothetical protein
MTDLEDDRMLDYLLWLLVGVGIGLYAAPALSGAKAQLVRRLRELDTTTSWLDEDPTDRDEERR